jgi:hypothetical protein
LLTAPSTSFPALRVLSFSFLLLLVVLPALVHSDCVHRPGHHLIAVVARLHVLLDLLDYVVAREQAALVETKMLPHRLGGELVHVDALLRHVVDDVPGSAPVLPNFPLPMLYVDPRVGARALRVQELMQQRDGGPQDASSAKMLPRVEPVVLFRCFHVLQRLVGAQERE